MNGYAIIAYSKYGEFYMSRTYNVTKHNGMAAVFCGDYLDVLAFALKWSMVNNDLVLGVRVVLWLATTQMGFDTPGLDW